MTDDLLEALENIKNLRRIIYDNPIDRFININGQMVDINHVLSILKDHFKEAL